MPRNAQGVYSLPSGNPVVTGTTIDSTWANPTLSDIASEITASLPRNGVAPMTGELILSGDATVDLAAVPKQQLDDEISDLTTAYEAADDAITTAYEAADDAITTAYEAADTTIQGNLDDHEGATGTSVHGLGTASTLTQTTSQTDTTNGRALKIGDLGYGLQLTLTETNLDDYPYSGVFLTPTSGVTNYPTTGGWSQGRHTVECYGSYNYAVQIMTALSGVNQRWMRYRSSSTWSDWILLYHNENIVGTVSQSSGTPTGAVMESDSGDDYIRFADGTQICYGNVSGSSSDDVTWTYPKAFSVAPVVIGTSVSVSGGEGSVTIALNSTTSCDVSSYTGSTRQARGINLIAIGKWF